jgi:hypothetical protein
MPEVDKNEAPDGFCAVSIHDIKGPALFLDTRCNGCALQYGSRECDNAPCGRQYRHDGCDVVFQPKKPKDGIDYRMLLRKYISHVGICEGVDFIDPDDHSTAFTPEEWAELRKLSKEADEIAGR